MSTSLGDEDIRSFTQTPSVDFGDEGVIAVTANFGVRFDPRLEKVVNPWVSFGPLAGPGRLINASLSYREYYPAAMGVRQIAPPYFSVSTGAVATLFRSKITYQRPMVVRRVQLFASTQPSPALNTTTIVLAPTRDATPTHLNVSSLDEAFTMTIKAGGWFALWSPITSNAQVVVNRVSSIAVRIIGPRHDPAWFTAAAAISNASVAAGDSLVAEFAQLGLSLAAQLPSVEVLLARLAYLRQPQARVHSGPQLDCNLICDTALNRTSNWTTDLEFARFESGRDMMLPLRVGGLNPRWSAGLWQKAGFPGSAAAVYGNGTDRYTALGIEEEGHAYVPIYTGEAAARVVVGHPVIADGDGSDQLFIQVVHVDTKPNNVWHVSMNNPTSKSITAMVRSTMGMAGFGLKSQQLEVGAGQEVILL